MNRLQAMGMHGHHSLWIIRENETILPGQHVTADCKVVYQLTANGPAPGPIEDDRIESRAIDWPW